ncbi:MAG: translation initiation factor [Muribaculaceae bacterium]|nr:translation initiation factor [Muribaculaceae bacterium]
MKDIDWKSALGALLPDDYQPEPESAPDLSARPRPRLTVTLDKKRAGKTATIISGFDADDPRAHELAALLKRKLATGGSSRGGEILVQGDRVDQVRVILREQGLI